MVVVYFETPNLSSDSYYSEKVATFEDEEVYLQCLDVLKEVAKEHSLIVTESII
jgi:hypothetical protein|tara:strand:+ start:1268 stop:1429 length:162 start_codon:yes stop_codon:yes gene_type:complete